MAGPLFFDRVKETCAAPGTGSITLLGAEPKFRAFADVMNDGDSAFVVIEDSSGTKWEVGHHVWISANEITRSAGDVLAGSDGIGVLVDFDTGIQVVRLDAPAAVLSFLALTAKGVRNNIGAVGVYTALIGDGSNAQYTILQSTHLLATTMSLIVKVYIASSGVEVVPDIAVDVSGNVVLTFSDPVDTDARRVVIFG